MYAAPFVTLPAIPISTANPLIVSNVTGRPVEEGATTSLSLEQLQGKVITLDAVIAEKTEENEALKAENEALKAQLAALTGGGSASNGSSSTTSKVAAALEGARATDAALNNS